MSPAAAAPLAGETTRAPVRRWLAARAFASWLPLQGHGLRTTALGLRRLARRAAGRVARGGLGGPGPRRDAGADGSSSLKEAIRRADLLLAHLADPQALAAGSARARGPARAC